MAEEKKSNLIAARPTETGSVVFAAVVGLLVAYGVIPEATAPNWIVVLGAVPAVITSLVVLFRKK